MELVYDSIIFDCQNYSSAEEMFKDIGTIMQILTKNDYIITFQYEDCGIYNLSFAPTNEELAASQPVWVTMEEKEMINDNRFRNIT